MSGAVLFIYPTLPKKGGVPMAFFIFFVLFVFPFLQAGPLDNWASFLAWAIFIIIPLIVTVLLVFLAWYQPLSTTNNTVTKGTKLPESRTVIRKLSFAPRSRAVLSLTIAAQFLRCRRRSSLVTAVRFLNGRKSLFIDCGDSKRACPAPLITRR